VQQLNLYLGKGNTVFPQKSQDTASQPFVEACPIKQNRSDFGQERICVGGSVRESAFRH
jgi:hypothetical protein